MPVMKYAKYIKKATGTHFCNMCGARINSSTHYCRFFPDEGYSKTYQGSVPVCPHCAACHISGRFMEDLQVHHPFAINIGRCSTAQCFSLIFKSKILGLPVTKDADKTDYIHGVDPAVDADFKTAIAILENPYIISVDNYIQKAIDRRKNFINKLKSMKK